MVEANVSGNLQKLGLIATSRSGAEAWAPRDGTISCGEFSRLSGNSIVHTLSGVLGLAVSQGPWSIFAYTSSSYTDLGRRVREIVSPMIHTATPGMVVSRRRYSPGMRRDCIRVGTDEVSGFRSIPAWFHS